MNNTFQTILLAVFGFFIVAGIALFATIQSNSKNDGVNLVVWGSIPFNEFHELKEVVFAGNRKVTIEYVEKDQDTFDRDFIEELARGAGPDVFLLPHDSIVRHLDKIVPIPYEEYSERDFKDAFIEAGELFLSPYGILALPFSVDPLVMYWNRDIFSNAGFSVPPKFWKDFVLLNQTLTQKDSLSNIVKSTVALGESRNIAHSKEIISALFFQGGAAVVPHSRPFEHQDFINEGTISALNFYTEFANPVKPSYSWNRSLPNSRNFFSQGDLAVYFGMASEYDGLRERNPNLNFDVALLPQRSEGTVKTTYGKMYGWAVSRNTGNVDGSFAFLLAMTSPEAIAKWSEVSNLPPVRRSLVGLRQSNAVQSVFYDSAIKSRAWLDPNRLATNTIFQNMVESITSGKSFVNEAVSRAGNEIGVMFGL